MAARHLQKLRGTQLVEPDAEGSGASEEEAPSSKKAPFNPFDLLSDDEVCLPCSSSGLCPLSAKTCTVSAMHLLKEFEL